MVEDWMKEPRQAEDDLYTERGVLWAVRNADHLSGHSDDLFDNPFPRRYGIDHYKKNDFEIKFGDFRDVGYVLSYADNSVSGAIHHHASIKLVLDHCVPLMLMELFDEPTHDSLSGWYDQPENLNCPEGVSDVD
jgi:hypothetical protein